MATILQTLRSQKRKPIAEQVMVITGASSGIGLETALMAARQGARVVLASRNERVMADVVDQIENAGGTAFYLVTDVSQKVDLEALIAATIERFGGFDTWVNNAGVEIWGKLVDGDEAENRRLFDINFWGLVEGSMLALQHLKTQGGTIINIGSVESDRAFPLQGIYAASKHAVKAFTDALRMEIEHDGLPVHVTLIKPASIATPLASHAANHLAREIQLPPPLYKAENVAQAILHAAVHPTRDIMIGGSGRIMSLLGKLSPRLMDRISEALFFEAQQRKEAARPRQSNLFEHGQDGEIQGEHPGQQPKLSLYTQSRLHPWLSASLLLGFGLLLLSRRR